MSKPKGDHVSKAQDLMAKVAQATGVEASIAKIYERCDQEAHNGSSKLVIHVKYDVELFSLIVNNKNAKEIQEALMAEGLLLDVSDEQVVIGFDGK